MVTFCLYILMGLFFRYHCEAAVITVPPVSVTAPIYTAATFACEGTGDILNWLVESAVLTDSIKQQREITVTTTNTSNTNFSSVLTVNALPINDGLGIGCIIISVNPFNLVTSNSVLTIRGISSVGNIQYSFPTNHSLLITWSPPVYYSNDVPHLSPVSYQVLVTDEEDGDIILDTNTPNTNIEVPNITECDTFSISVTAILTQYTSIDNNTNKTNGNYSIAECGAQPLIPSISFEFGCPPSKCIVSLMDGNNEVTDIIIETEHIIEFKLSPFRHYELTAVVKNLMDKTRATYSTSLSTFHTKNISINSSYTNGSVSVQCVFVSGPTADRCHVIFTDTINGTVLNIPLVQGHTLVTLPAGTYTVTAYDNINGTLYGPAVEYPTQVEIIKVIPSTSTSSSIMTQSTATTQSTVSNTVIPTITVTPGTETTSSTSGTIDTNDYIVLVVASTVSGIVLVVLIIITICGGITVNKRKRMNVRVLARSEFATAQKPQADTNQYQAVHEIMNKVPNNTSPVQLTYNRSIDDEDSDHVTMSEFLPDNHTIPSHNVVEGQLMPQGQRPSLTSTTTQDTILEDSISSTTSNNNIHDNEYTTDSAVTVNVSNDTVTMTVTNTDAAAPTYASIAKRTDTTVPPTVPPTADQHVVYDKVTGDINKRGDVTLYHDDANNIVTGDLNSTTSKDEVAVLLDSPPSYYDLDTINDPVIELYGTGSPQTAPVDYTYPQAKEVSQMNEASILCVTLPVEQPKDESDHSSSRQLKKTIDAITESTPLLASFLNQPQRDNNNIAAQDDDDLLLFDDDDSLTTMTPENINNDMIIVSRATSQQLSGKDEEKNIEVLPYSFDDENKEEPTLAKCEENNEAILEEDNTSKSTCQSALQILLKYGIPITLSFLLCLLFVTVTVALLFCQCSGVYKTSDGDKHTEMVPVALLAYNYNYNWIEIIRKEDLGQGFIPHAYSNAHSVNLTQDFTPTFTFLSYLGDHCLNHTGDSVDALNIISYTDINMADDAHCEDKLKCYSPGFLRDEDTCTCPVTSKPLNATEYVSQMAIFTGTVPDTCTNCDDDYEYLTANLTFKDTITIGPKTTTGYVGGNISANATIPLPDSCTGPIIFVNDTKLSTPCTNLSIYGADGLEHLLYTINGVQESVDGRRIDVCIFCGNHYECFSPAYFYIKGWIYMIIKKFIISGTIQCATFLIIINTVWMNINDKVHFPELVEGLIRFFCHDTCCFTITKMISQTTITFQKDNWKILEGSCPTTPTTPTAVTPTDHYDGTNKRWNKIMKAENKEHPNPAVLLLRYN